MAAAAATPMRHADRDRTQRLTQDQPLDVACVGAERHPDADFTAPAAHDVGDDAVDADRGETAASRLSMPATPAAICDSVCSKARLSDSGCTFTTRLASMRDVSARTAAANAVEIDARARQNGDAVAALPRAAGRYI